MDRRDFVSILIGGATLSGAVAISKPSFAQRKVLRRDELQPTLTLEEMRGQYQKVFAQISDERFTVRLKSVMRPIDFNRVMLATERSQGHLEVIRKAAIEYSKPFLWSLQFPLRSFETFYRFSAEAERIRQDRINNVEVSETDLALKANHIKVNGTDSVEVTVHTNKNNMAVGGCDVYYAPEMDDDDRVRFDRFSTPTTDQVPPGAWWLWAELNGAEGRKVEFECGDDNRVTRTVDIPAP